MADSVAAVRREVRSRARDRCEYCGLPAAFAPFPHEVDHITALKHLGASSLDNLAWCCFACNRHKGSDLTGVDPLTGEIHRLFHPRLQAWDDHFKFVDGGRIDSLTGVGRSTARLLQFNALARVRLRLEMIRGGMSEI